MQKEKPNIPISVQTLKRLPSYLRFLKKLDTSSETNISSTVIANQLGLNEVQVRKDLASVSKNAGRPRTGFVIGELITDIESFLGFDNKNEAVIAGVGNLGAALYSYKGFKDDGIDIVAAFDCDPSILAKKIGGKPVLPVEKLGDLCKRMSIHIGIITVPALRAQEVCDRMVEGGILVIWNFTSVNLVVPDNVYVRNENMSSSIAMLTKALADKLNEQL
jgi:redox-sensing transcriptional repressor